MQEVLKRGAQTNSRKSAELERYFELFRLNTIGHGQPFQTPYGQKKIVYADWTASGRLYRPLEDKMRDVFGPFVGNTHTETNVTGTSMTQAYRRAHQIIKNHVHASPNDVLLFTGFGMTAAVCKLQRILGLRIPEQYNQFISLPPELKPVVFVTHMEHHSNQTSWYETFADVCVIKPTSDGSVDLDDLRTILDEHKNRKLKIGSFTACSNVTGIRTPYNLMAKIMHEHGGLCFVDLAASAPYVPIDMHPPDPLQKLDGIVFSPHKFLGGPGASGVLIFDASLYQLRSPDQPGGGTVLWTNPWGEYRYKPEIEEREDGGTPGFLQAVRAALTIELKEQMGVEKMMQREEQLVKQLFGGLRRIPGLTILADAHENRLGLLSFYLENIHYNLIVRLLNDRYGVQARGGCSCAGTYGHYLLHVDHFTSKRITDKIDEGDLSSKPGWVRLSIHPTTTDEEVDLILSALHDIQRNASEWSRDYTYDPHTNEFRHKTGDIQQQRTVDKWFEM
jgi:selenocysteine lyase/cysteine desulfurase